MRKIFITATDTDAGKTYVARLLTKALVTAGRKVAVYKPISAGCDIINGQLINEDAQLLQIEANCQQTIEQVNPIAFEPAIAPHIAALALNRQITLDDIIEGLHNISRSQAEIVITEGAGGWRLPLGQGKYLSEFVQHTQQQVILVVNMKLGCLNHAVLTYESIIADGLNCIGWVANCQSEMPYLEENIAELSELLPVPLLLQLGFRKDIEQAVTQVSKTTLALLSDLA